MTGGIFVPGGGGGGTPYDDLYGKASPDRGISRGYL